MMAAVFKKLSAKPVFIGLSRILLKKIKNKRRKKRRRRIHIAHRK